MINKRTMQGIYNRLDVKNAAWHILPVHTTDYCSGISRGLSEAINILIEFGYLEHDDLFERLCKLYVDI